MSDLDQDIDQGEDLDNQQDLDIDLSDTVVIQPDKAQDIQMKEIIDTNVETMSLM